jgi:hypothetical protein
MELSKTHKPITKLQEIIKKKKKSLKERRRVITFFFFKAKHGLNGRERCR